MSAITPPSGPLLALETSSALGSVALARDGEVVARRFLGQRRKHAARLVPAIHALLDEAGLAPGDLEAVVVGAGPGSFTGVRVAGATAKGLVHVLGIPLWAYSSLAAAAASHGVRLPSTWAGGDVGPLRAPATPGPGAPCTILFDARSDRVYTASYRRVDRELQVLSPPRACRLDDVLDEIDIDPGTVFAGDAALRHGWVLERAGYAVAGPPLGVPTAEGLVRLLRLSPREPVADPARWEPEYLRPWMGDAGAREGPEGS